MIMKNVVTLGLIITSLIFNSCNNRNEFYHWGYVEMQLCVNNEEIIIFDGNNIYIDTFADSASTSKFITQELKNLKNTDTVRVLCNYSDDIEISRKREISLMAGNLAHQFNSKPVTQFLFLEDRKFKICFQP